MSGTLARRVARTLPAAAAVLLVLPAIASSGQVQDRAGRPIVGARACLLLAPDVDGICVETDENGKFDLPGSEGAAIRILAEGFLSVNVGVVDHTAPIRLERAAGFEVRVVDDADGAAVADVRLWVLSPDGRRRGPIDLGGSGWLRMKTFPPGSYRLLASAPGYLDGTGGDLELRAGEIVESEIRLRRDPAATPPG